MNSLMNTSTLFDNIEEGDHENKDLGITNRFDRHEREIVRFLETEYGDLTEDEKLAAMLTSLFIRDGHVCMPADRTVSELAEILDPEDAKLRNLKTGKLHLKNSKIVGGSDSELPMILTGNRLYFHRYFRQEQNLKCWIGQKSRMGSGVQLTSVHKEYLNSLFGEDGAEINWQKVAAALSLIKPFLIVSGGPGTGKTTTVARLLALLQKSSDKSLKIALAAPTGKAAGRMGEALFGELQKLDLSEDQLRHFPAEAQTIHRLLREVEDRGLLPPVRRKTLRYDIVVIDEASMIDLSLIHRLIRHLSDSTKLVLLGDKDQLASVEAGSVFADLCTKKENYFHTDTIDSLQKVGLELPHSNSKVSAKDDTIVYLTKSYRFDEKSGIGRLAGEVKKGISDKNMLLKLFRKFDDIEHVEFKYTKEDFSTMNADIRKRIKQADAIKNPAELLDFWKKSVWLTVLRRGLSGSERLNRLTEQVLASTRSVFMQNGWYHGRPVMIIRNDYDLGIFNGDHGVCILDDEGEYRVHIQSGSGIKKIRPERLLHFSPAYFLTVHKSQGSEFGDVKLLLPANEAPILTKELLYTAITRAKSTFTLFGDPEIFMTASKLVTERFSGLRE